MLSDIFGYFLALFCTLAGTAILYYSYRMFKQYHLIRDLPISTVQSLAVGYVEVQGKVQPTTPESLLTHPLTGEKVVFYQKMLMRHTDNNFKMLDDTMHGDKFLIQDETGEVEVQIDNPRLDFDKSNIHTKEYYLKPNDTAPSYIQQYHAQTTPADLPEDESEFVYELVVYSLKPNDTAFVFGEAEMKSQTSSATNEDNLRIVNPDSRTPILASILPPQVQSVNGVLSSRGLPQIISTRTDGEFVDIAKTVVPAATAIGLAFFGLAIWTVLFII